jgi:RNA polymerase sigma-70 factor (ECF subfamily)
VSSRRQILDAIHLRILADDPTASNDLFELVHRPLWRVITGAYGGRGLSEEQAIDSATDALAEYIRNAHKYDSSRAGLFTYLAVIAKRDALNRLRSSITYSRHLHKLVELEGAHGNIGHEDSAATRIDAETILRRYGDRIVENDMDVAVLKLMLSGESDTDVYAAAIGAEALPPTQRIAAVKKYRDKIEKRLQRLGRCL